jgi:hypothetical protein
VHEHFQQDHTALVIPAPFRAALKRLPPFGREYLSRAPLVEGPWILIGSEAWREAYVRRETGATVMVMPGDEVPSTFRWPVSGEYVTVLQSGLLSDELVRQLAVELLYSGRAQAVFFQSYDGLHVFHPEQRHDR